MGVFVALVFVGFFLGAAWMHIQFVRMTPDEQREKLRSSEEQLRFPNAIVRAPAASLATLAMAAATGVLILLGDARESDWLWNAALTCGVGWVVGTALTALAVYTGRPSLLIRKDLPAYRS